jgi:hypothetical protein
MVDTYTKTAAAAAVATAAAAEVEAVKRSFSSFKQSTSNRKSSIKRSKSNRKSTPVTVDDIVGGGVDDSDYVGFDDDFDYTTPR